MHLKTFGRLAGALALTAVLAGCIDMTGEIEVLSETTGKATTTMTMGAEFYPMIKQMAAAGGENASSENAFCADEGDVLVENADGSATCTTIIEGELSKLNESDGPSEDASFTVVSPGVVRVAFKTEDMSGQVTEGQDEQTAAMMKAYFEGHTATIRIKGKRILDTNMTRVGDDTAELVIQFTDLLEGSANLPAEVYAVVDTR